MKFTKAEISGVFVLELEPHIDERGFFARTFCANEFEAHGLSSRFVQHNISFNKQKGTIRGLHYQVAPYGEIKVVSCIRGAIYDVVVDLRKESATYLKWEAFELSMENRRSVYIPEDCAHGFQTLSDNAEVQYLMGRAYVPDASRGLRWNDSAIGIKWPIEMTTISPKDEQYPGMRL